MVLYIIQDINEDPLKYYIASYVSETVAREAVLDLEKQDMLDNVYVPGTYVINKRYECHSVFTRTCERCVNGICILENPGEDCPVVKARRARRGRLDIYEEAL